MGHLNAPSRESGDERCLLPKGAQFVVQWRYGDRERGSLCVRDEVPPGVDTEVAEVDTAERDRAKELFSEVAKYHGVEIEEMEVAAEHVHIFISFPPTYVIAKVVGILKGVSAREIRKEFPRVKKESWGRLQLF